MTPPMNLFEKSKSFLFKHYSEDLSKMLLWTGTIAWITSAAGQIFGIATNKKISKKEKKFLIPQESLDAAINITSFFLVTRQIQNFSKKLVSKGHIITPKIKEFCIENGIKFVKEKGGDSLNIGKAVLDKVKQYTSVLDINKDNKAVTKLNLSNNQQKLIQDEIGKLNDFYDQQYAPFEGGLGVIGSLTGAVLSSNIITPILRNPIAAAKQKTSLAQEKLQNDAAMFNTTAIAPVLPAQNRLGIDDYRTKVMNASSGSMRV